MNSKDTGEIGEEIALIFLEQKGYKLIERNYLKRPFGEIDLILKKQKTIFFVEVKTTITSGQDFLVRNLNSEKIKKFRRISEIYLKEKKILGIKIKFLAIFVVLDEENKEAKIKIIDDLF